MIAERLARVLARWRLRREAGIRARREARWARREAESVTLAAVDAATARDRLDLATQLLLWSALFKDSPEGRWALEAHGCFELGHGLVVDRRAGVVHLGDRHWFGKVRDEILIKPQDLAARFTTDQLREILEAAFALNFWRRMVEIEVMDILGLRGRAVW